MGTYLAQPITTKTTNSSQSRQTSIKFTSCQMQGWRREMEDACICNLDLGDGNSLFGVFDGHGGNEVSLFVKDNFQKILLDSYYYKEKKYVEALSFTIHKIDQMLLTVEAENQLKQIREKTHKKSVTLETPKLKKNRRTISGNFKREKESKLEVQSAGLPHRKLSVFVEKSSDQENIDGRSLKKECGKQGEQKISERTGCTANVVLVTPEHFYIANTGDSQSIISRNNKCYKLSFDHKPTDEEELKRILKAGQQVIKGRINGGLNISRSIGDFAYKKFKNVPRNEQPVVCSPDIRTVERSQDDEFILIGCDGVFEKYYNSEQPLVDSLKKWRKKKSGPETLTQLFDKNIAKNTQELYGCDNMTAILIEFL